MRFGLCGSAQAKRGGADVAGGRACDESLTGGVIDRHGVPGAGFSRG